MYVVEAPNSDTSISLLGENAWYNNMNLLRPCPVESPRFSSITPEMQYDSLTGRTGFDDACDCVPVCLSSPCLESPA